MRIYCQQQRCSPRSVVSGDISFMPIFIRVRWWGGVKWECGRWKCEFSLSIAISSVWRSPLALHNEICTASRGFPSTARHEARLLFYNYSLQCRVPLAYVTWCKSNLYFTILYNLLFVFSWRSKTSQVSVLCVHLMSSFWAKFTFFVASFVTFVTSAVYRMQYIQLALVNHVRCMRTAVQWFAPLHSPGTRQQSLLPSSKTGYSPAGFPLSQHTISAFIAAHWNIGVGAQSTLGGHDIFARKICMKNY